MAQTTEAKLHSTMDAKVWAEEFMRIFGQKLSEIDEGLMIGWFANAIMCGSDITHNRQQKHIDKLKAILLLTDPAVSHVEMNKLSAAQFDAYERWCQTEI